LFRKKKKKKKEEVVDEGKKVDDDDTSAIFKYDNPKSGKINEPLQSISNNVTSVGAPTQLPYFSSESDMVSLDNRTATVPPSTEDDDELMKSELWQNFKDNENVPKLNGIDVGTLTDNDDLEAIYRLYKENPSEFNYLLGRNLGKIKSTKDFGANVNEDELGIIRQSIKNRAGVSIGVGSSNNVMQLSELKPPNVVDGKLNSVESSDLSIDDLSKLHDENPLNAQSYFSNLKEKAKGSKLKGNNSKWKKANEDFGVTADEIQLEELLKLHKLNPSKAFSLYNTLRGVLSPKNANSNLDDFESDNFFMQLNPQRNNNSFGVSLEDIEIEKLFKLYKKDPKLAADHLNRMKSKLKNQNRLDLNSNDVIFSDGFGLTIDDLDLENMWNIYKGNHSSGNNYFRDLKAKVVTEHKKLKKLQNAGEFEFGLTLDDIALETIWSLNKQDPALAATFLRDMKSKIQRKNSASQIILNNDFGLELNDLDVDKLWELYKMDPSAAELEFSNIQAKIIARNTNQNSVALDSRIGKSKNYVDFGISIENLCDMYDNNPSNAISYFKKMKEMSKSNNIDEFGVTMSDIQLERLRSLHKENPELAKHYFNKMKKSALPKSIYEDFGVVVEHLDLETVIAMHKSDPSSANSLFSRLKAGAQGRKPKKNVALEVDMSDSKDDFGVNIDDIELTELCALYSKNPRLATAFFNKMKSQAISHDVDIAVKQRSAESIGLDSLCQLYKHDSIAAKKKFDNLKAKAIRKGNDDFGVTINDIQLEDLYAMFEKDPIRAHSYFNRILSKADDGNFGVFELDMNNISQSDSLADFGVSDDDFQVERLVQEFGQDPEKAGSMLNALKYSISSRNKKNNGSVNQVKANFGVSINDLQLEPLVNMYNDNPNIANQFLNRVKGNSTLKASDNNESPKIKTVPFVRSRSSNSNTDSNTVFGVTLNDAELEMIWSRFKNDGPQPKTPVGIEPEIFSQSKPVEFGVDAVDVELDRLWNLYKQDPNVAQSFFNTFKAVTKSCNDINGKNTISNDDFGVTVDELQLEPLLKMYKENPKLANNFFNRVKGKISQNSSSAVVTPKKISLPIFGLHKQDSKSKYDFGVSDNDIELERMWSFYKNDDSVLNTNTNEQLRRQKVGNINREELAEAKPDNSSRPKDLWNLYKDTTSSIFRKSSSIHKRTDHDFGLDDVEIKPTWDVYGNISRDDANHLNVDRKSKQPQVKLNVNESHNEFGLDAVTITSPSIFRKLMGKKTAETPRTDQIGDFGVTADEMESHKANVNEEFDRKSSRIRQGDNDIGVPGDEVEISNANPNPKKPTVDVFKFGGKSALISGGDFGVSFDFSEPKPMSRNIADISSESPIDVYNEGLSPLDRTSGGSNVGRESLWDIYREDPAVVDAHFVKLPENDTRQVYDASADEIWNMYSSPSSINHRLGRRISRGSLGNAAGKDPELSSQWSAYSENSSTVGASNTGRPSSVAVARPSSAKNSSVDEEELLESFFEEHLPQSNVFMLNSNRNSRGMPSESNPMISYSRFLSNASAGAVARTKTADVGESFMKIYGNQGSRELSNRFTGVNDLLRDTQVEPLPTKSSHNILQMLGIPSKPVKEETAFGRWLRIENRVKTRNLSTDIYEADDPQIEEVPADYDK